ncbi:hypothetical protein [Desulfomonile tiedjei]|uniref:DUF883 family protein n=1 Tax=Desulfomonile tiedjei (strain ATCC 49306 / DSM 6799 / DCB-1) TaxID=706587 RepID=I4C3E4_DESTA|nr:hypothetical protein [Desulfomonile tiedjei]AFM24085.1 hypothetical protein Desti_1373 [Desulfomonile tiedjei DSM 6799]
MNTEDQVFEQHTLEETGGTVIPKDIRKAGAETYQKVEHAASQAYDQTSKVLSDSYHQVSEYAHKNPERTTLIAFGVGLGLGLLLAGRGGGGWRSNRYYAAPVIDALYDVAMAFVRR